VTDSRQELYRLFDRSPIGIYRSREDGTLLYVNEAFARILGYTVDEALALNLNRDVYVDPAARAALIASYRPLGAMNGARVAWKTRTGEPRTVQLWGHMCQDEALVSFDAWAIDITDTERDKAELAAQREELQRNATMLDLIFGQMPAVYYLVDRDLRILRTGGAIETVLGYKADLYVGMTLAESHAHDGGDTDPVGPHQRALRGETVTFLNHYRGKHLSSSIAPYRLNGEIAGAIGVSIDVTATRALEERMVEAQRAESLGMLAGGLAHDFNNLLVAILGNADLALREIPPGAPGRTTLENIRLAGLRAAELTDQLLAYAGRGTVARTRVALRPLVDELLRLTAPSLAGVATRVEIADDLVLSGDSSNVRQVVMNLVANARDALAGRAGTIAITARALHHDGEASPDDILAARPGLYARIEISDDGPGIAPGVRHRIFEPFFTTKEAGHGLGLAAVLGIVRTHAGGLRVVSTASGTTFVVWWPLATSAERDVVVAPPTRTVLVIDDEDLVRDVVTRMIQDLGYGAVSAPDGASGLAMVDAQPIDLVLVDMTMPRMSGADVIGALRAKHPAIPIVLCSGYDRDGKGPAKADAYLPKPFRIDALEQTLARLLPHQPQ
jgi:PAS domain S-box-containing protein